jgi:hypothetical protein
MSESDWLAGRFEQDRPHLRAVAYRMLGSAAEADDAVQDAWLRVSRADTTNVQNLTGWLTTIVARVCLNLLQSRDARREQPLDQQEPQTTGADPQDHIAPIVGRSPAAVRQLASRGRRRVQGSAAVPETDRVRQRKIVDAFLAASRNGDFTSLLALLDPDVVLRADATAVQTGATNDVIGAAAVAKQFAGRARAARLALIDGVAGLVWAPGGQARVVFDFTIVDGKIVEIEILADPDRLRELDVKTDR